MPTPRTRLGTRGEALARRFLEELGYRVLSTNYRCTWGEIDIVAQDGSEVVFVEVRTRRGAQFGSPEESLTASKVRHLIAAAQEYLQSCGGDEASWRIDLVGVRLRGEHGGPKMEHWKNIVEE